MDSIPKRLYPGVRDTKLVRGLGVLDLLENDPRLTFMLDVGPFDSLSEKLLSIIYWNPALEEVESGSLLITLLGKRPTNGFVESYKSDAVATFRRWILSSDRTSDRLVY